MMTLAQLAKTTAEARRFIAAAEHAQHRIQITKSLSDVNGEFAEWHTEVVR